ncbi:hypothetical protein [Halorientalis salina]|uniref:hypothetical protein n=1 Tax=Halorientalis salina TaxID=2932266 RepID=UPI0010AB6AF0|nr:hypothetical protein [Halorientalis salina]
MDEKYERGILRISAVFVLAAALLVPLGFLGMPATLSIVGGMLALAFALFYAWQYSDAYNQYLSGLWLGPAIAAAFALYGLFIGASPGELQALGGIAGLIGVLNLLLRPVYRLIHYVLTVTLQIGREIQEEGW